MRKILMSMIVTVAVIFSYFGYCHAEVFAFKSSLVWRTDGKGDYILPALVNGEYQPTEAVTTQGQITSISVLWKFSGKVLLEVSANDGINYTPVLNGVPLTTGFITGNRLRWRAKIYSAESQLQEVVISYTDTTGVIGNFGQPKLSGFKFRKPIYISSPSGSELGNYQLKITIGESEKAESYDISCVGKISKDFQDVRFTAPDGETLLPYFLESITGKSPNRLATFWVKVPEIYPANIPIYVYYGNKVAGDLSNAREVFDFFEDFSGGPLNKEIWEEKSGEIISKEFEFSDGTIEYRATGVNEVVIRGNKNDESINQAVKSSDSELNEHCIKVGEFIKANSPKPIIKGNEYNYRVIARGGQITFQRYDADFKELQNEVNFNDIAGLDSGYLGLKSIEAPDGIYDWVRVRKCVTETFTEPKVDKEKTTNAKEENVDLAVFTGITLAENGNLILAGEYNIGNYISTKFSSAFPVRVIVPTWQAGGESKDGLSIGISTDGGDTYKQGCTNETYYYASKKDFTMGNLLIAQVKLNRKDKQAASPQLESVCFDYRPGKITLFSPNGGESWGGKTEKEISWTAADYEVTYPIQLQYSIDGGKKFTNIIDQAENTGVYLWSLPEITSKEVIVRISDASDINIYDTSDKPFELTEPRDQDSFKAKGLASWNNPTSWANSKVPDLNTEVVIDNGVTISTEADIKFRTLTIGDGTGNNKSTLILTHNIDPSCTEITIRKGGTLVINNTNKQVLAGNLTIKNGGMLTHSQNIDSLKFKIDISALNIILEPGAMVFADGKGYMGGETAKSGKGKGPGVSGFFKTAGVGGSYGGAGGKSKDNDNKPASYGSVKAPQELGSGGAGGQNTKGGAGGGFIRLNAKEAFSIYGEITANGEDGGEDPQGKYDGGGGAGGTIHLSANTFGGAKARILAVGGSGHKSGGGGAGGRIYAQGGGVVAGIVNSNGGEGFEAGRGGPILFE